MIQQEGIQEIFATYKKYRWHLRRLLACSVSRDVLARLAPEIPIEESAIDAAWFSREPKDGSIAWEIRYLGDPPFALLESLDESDDGFSDKRQAVELRLSEAIKGKLDKH